MKPRPRVYKTSLKFQRLERVGGKGRRYKRVTYYGINSAGKKIQRTFTGTSLDYNYLKYAFLKHIERIK